jgi:hypothetical protein
MTVRPRLYIGRAILNLAVSDANKALLLRNPAFVAHLLDGLLLDPAHPRRTGELAGNNQGVTVPVASEACAAAVQRDFAEGLQQLSLFAPGREALLGDARVRPALEALARGGATQGSAGRGGQGGF